MRKLAIANYKVKVNGTETDYDVRDSLADMLLAPNLKLNGTGLLANNALATKIAEAPGPDVLLEEAEYQTLRNACNTLTGYARQDVELVRRVMEAPEVTVKEASHD